MKNIITEAIPKGYDAHISDGFIVLTKKKMNKGDFITYDNRIIRLLGENGCIECEYNVSSDTLNVYSSKAKYCDLSSHRLATNSERRAIKMAMFKRGFWVNDGDLKPFPLLSGKSYSIVYDRGDTKNNDKAVFIFDSIGTNQLKTKLYINKADKKTPMMNLHISFDSCGLVKSIYPANKRDIDIIDNCLSGKNLAYDTVSNSIVATRFHPAIGQMYWFVREDLIVSNIYNSNSIVDNGKIASRNCFRSKEEADEMMLKIKKVLFSKD